MAIIVTRPEITAAALSPLTVEAKGSVTVSVTVTERSITLDALPFASGEIAAGEA